MILSLHSNGTPGWSPRANQRWTALFQRFHKFQRWSALFQNGLRKPALISAVSELVSAGFLWINAVQRWIKTNWETDKNASCKFEKVLGSRETCSFGVYQLWKNHSGEILWIFGFSALFQRKSALKQLWFSADFFTLKISSFRAVSEKISAVHLWISSVSEKISAISARYFPFSALFRAESALFRDFQVINSAETDLKVFWIRADQRWLSLRRQPGTSLNILRTSKGWANSGKFLFEWLGDFKAKCT